MGNLLKITPLPVYEGQLVGVEGEGSVVRNRSMVRMSFQGASVIIKCMSRAANVTSLELAAH